LWPTLGFTGYVLGSFCLWISQALHGPSDANDAFVFALRQAVGPNLPINLSEEDEFKYNTDPTNFFLK
jgi:hypothetical protein